MISDYWRVEVALGSAPYASSQNFTDITSQVRRLSFSHERGRPNQPVKPAQASITVDNRDARWSGSSTYASSPYAGNVIPDRRVRLSIRESDTASWVVLATLFLENVDDRAGFHDSTATLQCSDLFRLLAQAQPVDITRPAELTGQRVAALLNAASIPAGLRSTIDNGTVMLAPDDLSGQVLGLIHEVSRVEQSYCLTDTLGRIEWRDRYHWLDETALNASQATFAADEFLSIQIEHRNSAFDYQRAVVASGDSGTAKLYASTYAAADFPDTVHQELSTPIMFDGDAEVLAECIQKQAETVDPDQSNPMAVEFFVASNSSTNSTVLADIVDTGSLPVTLLTYVSLLYRPIGWSSDRDAQCRVERYEHVVTPEQWRWRLGFSPADTRWRAEAANSHYTFGTTIVSDRRGSL